MPLQSDYYNYVTIFVLLGWKLTFILCENAFNVFPSYKNILGQQTKLTSATQHSLPEEGSHTGPNDYNTQSALMRLNKVN